MHRALRSAARSAVGAHGRGPRTRGAARRGATPGSLVGAGANRDPRRRSRSPARSARTRHLGPRQRARGLGDGGLGTRRRPARATGRASESRACRASLGSSGLRPRHHVSVSLGGSGRAERAGDARERRQEQRLVERRRGARGALSRARSRPRRSPRRAGGGGRQREARSAARPGDRCALGSRRPRTPWRCCRPWGRAASSRRWPGGRCSARLRPARSTSCSPSRRIVASNSDGSTEVCRRMGAGGAGPPCANPRGVGPHELHFGAAGDEATK